MKKLMLLSFVLLFVMSVVSAANYPSPRNQYVNDFGGILSQSQVGELQGLFASVEEQTTAQMVFVSLQTINGSDIGDYAVQLGRQWGVGQSDNNNGLVILYVADVNKIYVASGYGVEGILPDSKIGRLLDENYVPARDSGNLSEGIVAASEALAQVMFDNAAEIKSGNASGGQSTGMNYEIVAAVIFWIIFIVVALIRNYRNAKKKAKSSNFPWWILLFMPSGRSSGSGWSGGGFGGGGGGFGGGGFGGGGAGR